mgnify:FL=1
MSLSVLYRAPGEEEAWDVTTLVTACTWTTKRTGSPAALELTVLRSETAWVCGGMVAARRDGETFFQGYVFKVSSGEGEELSITAYDQLRYLKYKESYVFEGQRADQILAQIAADFKLKTGDLPNTGYVIPRLVEDGTSLLDIILKALDLTLVHGGQMFYLWDDCGALRLGEVTGEGDLPVIGDGSLATGYTYDVDIDGETYNQIKLVQGDGEEGNRKSVMRHDPETQALWGILQDYQQVDGEMNEAQMRQEAERRLELYNRPARTLELRALALPEVRAGKTVYIRIGREGLEQPFLVEEARHDLMAETMNLKVKVI